MIRCSVKGVDDYIHESRISDTLVIDAGQLNISYVLASNIVTHRAMAHTFNQ